jgi:sec-independent protein translocase protein TatB
MHPPRHALLPLRRGSMMKDMGFSETIFLFFLALLIFGPKKLPEIARQMGKVLNEVKRASNEFKAQITSEISQLDMENQRQILPPSEPPKGAVAALPVTTEPRVEPSLETSPEHGIAPNSEAHTVAKAPDA